MLFEVWTVGWYHLIQMVLDDPPVSCLAGRLLCRHLVLPHESSPCLAPSAQATEPRSQPPASSVLLGPGLSLPAGTEEPSVTGSMREADRGTITALTFC